MIVVENRTTYRNYHASRPAQAFRLSNRYFGNSVVNQTSALRFKIAELVLSIVGGLIAGTVYIADSRNIDLPCSSNGGCEIIANSPQSHLSLFGASIPVALLGLAGYVIILSIVMFRLGADDPKTARLAHVLQVLIAGGGFAYSWYLQYVAHFVIGAFCPWCFSSACDMSLIFILSTIDLIKNKSVAS
jgi:uncharacterized membrane protein